MTEAQVQRLLALASAYDSRNLSEAETQAWLLLLEPYDPEDAKQALLEWYRGHRERVMPSDLITIIDGWRDQWVSRGHAGDKPPGWPASRAELISGEEVGRRVEAAGGWEALKARPRLVRELPPGEAAAGE
jgi:hypothetical protein